MNTQRINLQLFATPQPQEEAERDKQFKVMQRELTIMKSVNTYMDTLEMSKETAQRYAEARADGDSDKENEILRQHMKSFKANVMQSFLKSRGEVKQDTDQSKAKARLLHLQNLCQSTVIRLMRNSSKNICDIITDSGKRSPFLIGKSCNTNCHTS